MNKMRWKGKEEWQQKKECMSEKERRMRVEKEDEIATVARQSSQHTIVSQKSTHGWSKLLPRGVAVHARIQPQMSMFVYLRL